MQTSQRPQFSPMKAAGIGVIIRPSETQGHRVPHAYRLAPQTPGGRPGAPYPDIARPTTG